MSTVAGSPIVSDVGQFAMVPKWLFDSEITAGALHLWVALAMKADRADHDCWPSRSTLAKEMGCAERTVDARIQELVELGAVQKEARFTPEGDRTSNCYHLRFARGGAELDTTPGAEVTTTGGAASCAGTRTRTNENQLNQKRDVAKRTQEEQERCGQCEDGWIIDLDLGPGSVKKCPNGCSQRRMEALR